MAKAKEIEVLDLMCELARDVLNELIKNLNKDIDGNEEFWSKMRKKYLRRIDKLESNGIGGKG